MIKRSILVNVKIFVKENRNNKQIGLLIQRLENNSFNKKEIIDIIKRIGLKNKTQISIILERFDIKNPFPTVKINGRNYYADEGKRQFRNKDNSHDIISYDKYFKECLDET